ncbi:MAG: hypothetical protein Q8N44_16865, partial [Rubrivivax sp.]|nr:hypothetical protein [Rubrivivax sp.]
LPAAVALRGWRRLAQPLNGALSRAVDGARLAAFQRRLPAAGGLQLCIIVMPQTLHFLLPCLALLQGRSSPPPLLLFNGATAWERRLLRQRLPQWPMFRLLTLPASSQSHGDVINLLLRHARADFALVDHDAYVFDPGLWARLQPAPDDAVVGVFAQHSGGAGWDYPLTHVLAFNVGALRGLMQRHGVDARLCHQAPARLAENLASVGLGRRRYLKDYQQFHDTLHLLLALARADGLNLRFEPLSAAAPVLHVGGTSIGSHHTKDLFALYIHLRFLALVGDPVIQAHYAALVRPLRSADALRQNHDPADPAWQALPVVDELMQRLQAAGAGSALNDRL